jgi:hypothetical protein
LVVEVFKRGEEKTKRFRGSEFLAASSRYISALVRAKNVI